MDMSQKGDTKGIVGIVIIVLILAIGGIYFWVTKNPSLPKTTTSGSSSVSVPPRNDAQALNAEFSSSTNVNIDADLSKISNDLGK